ncbi:MAG TPA: hypothetical protein VF151_09815 [Gemmatimonadales bacterium]
MSWRTWLHKITSWDMVISITVVVVLAIIAVVAVTLEDCSGEKTSDQPPAAMNPS